MNKKLTGEPGTLGPNQTFDSEKNFAQIFDESPVTLSILMGPDHVYTKANQRFFELSGYPRDVIGKSIKDIYHGINREKILETLDHVFTTGEKVETKDVLVTLNEPNGSTRRHYLDFSYQPLKDDHGVVRGIISRTFDVTDRVLARKAIENERQNLRNLFRQTPEMVCYLLGPEHRFEFVNEAHIKALGFDATGMTVREAQPESVEVHGILDTVYRTGRTAELFEIPVTVGDRLRYFNLTYAARRDEEGEINGVMILGMEVSDQIKQLADRKIIQEELEKSRERYRLLFDYSPLPKIIFDIETLRIIDVNKTAVKHYGYSREEFLQRTKADLRPPEDVAQLHESLIHKHSQTEVEVHTGLRHVKKDGTVIHVEISALDIILNGRSARLCAIVDVTDKVRAEVEQKRLVQGLQEAKAEAERANTLKSAFLANMSHEIRTPLGAMIGFADLLRDPGLSREEHSSYINIVTRNGEQLSAIINDILDLSKVEAGHLAFDFSETSPENIAADVISLLRVKANEKNVVLEYTPTPSSPRSVVTDPLRLRQILMNIVGNAIKFTQVGSVKVKSFGEKDPKGHMNLFYEVADTGIGIPASQHDKVFDAFVQADGALSRKYGGTGLGLALSQQLAQELGGDLKLTKSIEGKGSTFLISIADKPELNQTSESARQREETKNQEIAQNALENIRVLIVDDSPDNRQLLWHFLTKYGAIVDFAENGLLGYRKALQGNFDIVLMDIQMPEMDGYTATQKLRETGFAKPIIALTAHAMDEVRKKCLNVGCTDHLTKPIRPKELIEAVVKYTHS